MFSLLLGNDFGEYPSLTPRHALLTQYQDESYSYSLLAGSQRLPLQSHTLANFVDLNITDFTAVEVITAIGALDHTRLQLHYCWLIANLKLSQCKK